MYWISRQRLLTLTLLFLITLIFIVGVVSGQRNHACDRPVRLGNPLAADGQRGRALNVWDLQAFQGKIYLAGGSTVTNAGPINVWAYDPGTKSFVKEYQVQEEAIEHYKVFEDKLYIPAADPRNADKNKYYRRNHDGTWTKYAGNAIRLAHVRDLIHTGDNHILLVGNNRNVTKDSSIPGAAITIDDGLSFQEAGLDSTPGNVMDFNWFFSVFSYQDRIYAPTSLLRDIENYASTIAVYNPETKKFILEPNLKNDEFIPARQIGKNRGKYGMYVIYRLWNPVEFKDYLIYPVRSYANVPEYYEQFYMNSLGMYLKEEIGKSPQKIKLPHKAIGEDVLIIDDELYVLANKRKSRNEFIIYVYKTNNPANNRKWQKVLDFPSTNKARSFEYLDGKFYFGLGQDYGDAIANSGDILSYTLK
ncbi:MAG: hypothetical protein Tsb0014_00110 [Pleurocapsa sp.]